MADDGTASQLSVDLDEEGKRLQLEAEKAKYREAIAKAAQGAAEAKASTVQTMVPDVADAPKGEVTLGEAAGALGPWLTHRAIDEAATLIADKVRPALGQQSRVLVLEDRSLLLSDWTRFHAKASLDEAAARLAPLTTLAGDASTRLDEAVRTYEEEEAGGTPRRLQRVDTEEPARAAPQEGEEPVGAEASGETLGAGALAAASGLLGLLRTDYALTASAATTSSWELAALTAAHLAEEPAGIGTPEKQQSGEDGAETTEERADPGANTDEKQHAAYKLSVHLDDFGTVDDSSVTVRRFQEVRKARGDVARALTSLEGRLSPLESELATLKARIARLEEAWTTAVTSKEADVAKGAASIRAEIDVLVSQLTRREKAWGPAQAQAAGIRQDLAQVDVATSALLQSSEGARPMLLTAIAREGLHSLSQGEGSAPAEDGEPSEDAQPRVTHVLYVGMDEAKGDVVTRRSLLGTSGRLGFIGAINASWLLLDAESGLLAHGGAVAHAKRMLYDLEAGQGATKAIDLNGTIDGKDPLTKLESYARLLVVIVVIFLGIVGVLAVVNVMFG